MKLISKLNSRILALAMGLCGFFIFHSPSISAQKRSAPSVEEEIDSNSLPSSRQVLQSIFDSSELRLMYLSSLIFEMDGQNLDARLIKSILHSEDPLQKVFIGYQDINNLYTKNLFLKLSYEHTVYHLGEKDTLAEGFVKPADPILLSLLKRVKRSSTKAGNPVDDVYFVIGGGMEINAYTPSSAQSNYIIVVMGRGFLDQQKNNGKALAELISVVQHEQGHGAKHHVITRQVVFAMLSLVPHIFEIHSQLNLAKHYFDSAPSSGENSENPSRVSKALWAKYISEKPFVQNSNNQFLRPITPTQIYGETLAKYIGVPEGASPLDMKQSISGPADPVLQNLIESLYSSSEAFTQWTGIVESFLTSLRSSLSDHYLTETGLLDFLDATIKNLKDPDILGINTTNYFNMSNSIINLLSQIQELSADRFARGGVRDIYLMALLSTLAEDPQSTEYFIKTYTDPESEDLNIDALTQSERTVIHSFDKTANQISELPKHLRNQLLNSYFNGKTHPMVKHRLATIAHDIADGKSANHYLISANPFLRLLGFHRFLQRAQATDYLSTPLDTDKKDDLMVYLIKNATDLVLDQRFSQKVSSVNPRLNNLILFFLVDRFETLSYENSLKGPPNYDLINSLIEAAQLDLEGLSKPSTLSTKNTSRNRASPSLAQVHLENMILRLRKLVKILQVTEQPELSADLITASDLAMGLTLQNPSSSSEFLTAMIHKEVSLQESFSSVKQKTLHSSKLGVPQSCLTSLTSPVKN